jgi:hypothetical protein
MFCGAKKERTSDLRDLHVDCARDMSPNKVLGLIVKEIYALLSCHRVERVAKEGGVLFYFDKNLWFDTA